MPRMNRNASKRRAAGLALELSGVVGLIATLVLFGLAMAGWVEDYFWQAAAVAVLGNTVYIVYQLAQWLTGTQQRRWRSLVLANLVPVIALALALLLSVANLGLVSLPGQHKAPSSSPRVITVNPDKAS